MLYEVCVNSQTSHNIFIFFFFFFWPLEQALAVGIRCISYFEFSYLYWFLLRPRSCWTTCPDECPSLSTRLDSLPYEVPLSSDPGVRVSRSCESCWRIVRTRRSIVETLPISVPVFGTYVHRHREDFESRGVMEQGEREQRGGTEAGREGIYSWSPGAPWNFIHASLVHCGQREWETGRANWLNHTVRRV